MEWKSTNSISHMHMLFSHNKQQNLQTNNSIGRCFWRSAKCNGEFEVGAAIYIYVGILPIRTVFFVYSSFLRKDQACGEADDC